MLIDDLRNELGRAHCATPEIRADLQRTFDALGNSPTAAQAADFLAKLATCAEPREPGRNPRQGEPGYNPRQGEPGYDPRHGEPGYDPRHTPAGHVPKTPEEQAADASAARRARRAPNTP